MSDFYDKIAQYIDGQMPAEEKTVFEQQMLEDKELAAEVELMKMTKESISRQLETEEEEKELRSIISEVTSEAPVKGKVVKMDRRFWLGVAGIAASIALFLFIWRPQTGNLYEKYAEHPELSLTVRSDGGNDLVPSIESSFNKKNYETALDLINRYEKDYGLDAEFLLMQGICFLELKRYPRALENFEELFKGDSVNKWEGAWYLGLTYLQMYEEGKDPIAKEKCIDILQQIPSGSSRHSSANQLLVDLD